MKLLTGILAATLTSVVAIASANAADMYVPGPGGYKDGPAYVDGELVWPLCWCVNGGYGWNALAIATPESSSTRLAVSAAARSATTSSAAISCSAWKPISKALGYSTAALRWANVVRLDWLLARVRGRLGYAFDRALVYATGGFALMAAMLPELDSAERNARPVGLAGARRRVQDQSCLVGSRPSISISISDATDSYQRPGPLGDASLGQTDVTHRPRRRELLRWRRLLASEVVVSDSSSFESGAFGRRFCFRRAHRPVCGFALQCICCPSATRTTTSLMLLRCCYIAFFSSCEATLAG